MKYTTKKEVWELQEKHGIPQHSHLNGLMTCFICVELVVFGGPGKMFENVIKALEKDLFSKKDK